MNGSICWRSAWGTGLRLVISKRLAQLLGGDVVLLDGRPGVGTRFRATIGAGSLDGVRMVEGYGRAAAVAPGDDCRCAAEVAEVGGASTPEVRVLLAEDGVDDQRLIVHFLKSAGCAVTVVANGQLAFDRALAALEQGAPFDVVLMDMQVPVLDGYAATGRLRAAGYPGPIIALTAHAMSEDRQKCLDAGCDDYASKPIDRERLIALVRGHAAGPMHTRRAAVGMA